jgi:hypothetical protein
LTRMDRGAGFPASGCKAMPRSPIVWVNNVLGCAFRLQIREGSISQTLRECAKGAEVLYILRLMKDCWYALTSSLSLPSM